MPAAFCLTLALLCGACSSTARLYEGPARPLEEVAVVEIEDASAFSRWLHSGFSATGSILWVDGEQVDARRVELLPGPHELCVSYGLRGMNSTSYTARGVFL